MTISRVGKGLDSWKRYAINHGAENHTFVFVGYSDRDKDICLVLAPLENAWLWLFHESLPAHEHVTNGSLLENMLSRPNRAAVITNVPALFDGYREASAMPSIAIPVAPHTNWKPFVDPILETSQQGSRCAALGDILYELLGDWANAERAYSFGLESVDRETPLHAMLWLRRNRVYGDRWKLEDLEKSLTQLDVSIADGATISTEIQALVARQWAALYQKQAIRHSEKAEHAFTKEEALWRNEGRPAEAALSAMNRAVVLQKRGLFRKAEELYRSAISELRTEGHLPHLAKALVNFGSVLGQSGKNDDALPCYREALDIFYMLGEELWVARLKSNIGTLLVDIGDTEEAKSFLRESEVALSKFQDSYWLQNTRDALARIDRDATPNPSFERDRPEAACPSI